MAIQLNRREKLAVIAGSGILGLFIIVQFIISPIMEKRSNAVKAIGAKTRIVKEMQILQSEYQNLQKQAELSKKRFAGREKGFSLFSFLDQLAHEVGVKDNIPYMKPSTSVRKESPYKISAVEMKLQDVTLEQLTTYLYKVETSKKLVSIKRISISKSKQDQGLNAVLQVETVML